MNIIEIKNLNLGFKTEEGFLQALYDVSLNIKRGTMHALVGESGCGKTLTAMSILQLLPKTAEIKSGEILFENKSLLALPQKDLQKIRGSKIALIPQDPMTSLNPLYTIGNQLIEVIKLHQKVNEKEAEKIAMEALDAVQIPNAKKRLNAYPHEFSGGMKQRAIIAMALACKAQLLIADEPTTALDVTIQAQIMDLLNIIKKDFSTSILLITHDLGLVAQNSDEISLMYAGRIVSHTTTEKFFKKPQHPYAKSLLNSRPQMLEGEKLATIKGQPPTLKEKITGCTFHPRCEFCMETCKSKIPQLQKIDEDYYSACFLK